MAIRECCRQQIDLATMFATSYFGTFHVQAPPNPDWRQDYLDLRTSYA